MKLKFEKKLMKNSFVKTFNCTRFTKYKDK